MPNVFPSVEIAALLTDRTRSWQQDLQLSLTQQGFRDARIHHYEVDLSMARYWHDMYVVPKSPFHPA